MSLMRNVSVCVDDYDSFFAKGIFALMEEFFLLQGIRIYPKQLSSGHTLPDVIFSSSLSHIPSCRLWSQTKQTPYPLLFLIESGPARHTYNSDELCGLSYVWRKDSTYALIERFKRVWFDSRRQFRLKSEVCQTCHKNGLTPREIELLKLLRKQMTIPQIAQIMGISYKTAFCFKLNAIRKLGVKNRRQLHDWLNNEISEDILRMDTLY